MELFFPILGLAVLYLLSWISCVYLLVQFILGARARRGFAAWSILWISVWPAVLLGAALTALTWNLPFSVLTSVRSLGTIFAPLLWLVAFGLFRREAAAEKRKDAEAQAELECHYILDIRPRNDVWPPPPMQ